MVPTVQGCRPIAGLKKPDEPGDDPRCPERRAGALDGGLVQSRYPDNV